MLTFCWELNCSYGVSLLLSYSLFFHLRESPGGTIVTRSSDRDFRVQISSRFSLYDHIDLCSIDEGEANSPGTGDYSSWQIKKLACLCFNFKVFIVASNK